MGSPRGEFRKVIGRPKSRPQPRKATIFWPVVSFRATASQQFQVRPVRQIGLKSCVAYAAHSAVEKKPSACNRSQAANTSRAVRYSPCILTSFSLRTRKVSEGRSEP